ncbi:MAG: hypothetical protein HN948_01275 [Clostridia bacterium]|jgi:hypothetical protein|nr:hypothetical protein [Clostridia bacterium]MBT7121621.1 hypothetical protein [Clostridia bacterium]
MNALRRSLKECNATFKKVRFLNSLMRQSKYIFAFGAFAWILGGLIPDTAYFAVTFFSSLARPAVFIGLFLTLVRGDEDRFIMIISIIISIGALIIIIVELSAAIYYASFETYLYLFLFFTLAVNSGKYIKNRSWYVDEEEKDDDVYLKAFSDIPSHTSSESTSPIQVKPITRNASSTVSPESPTPPIASPEESQTPLRKTPPTQPEAPAPPMTAPAQSETVQEKTPSQTYTPATPAKTSSTRPSGLKRAPSVKSAPSVGRAPRVRLKPKE